MIIQLLIVKSYKGTSKSKQTEIAQSLGFVKTGSLIWEQEVTELEDIKRIEHGLKNKVPYLKLNR